jgi:hypothetical protein
LSKPPPICIRETTEENSNHGIKKLSELINEGLALQIQRSKSPAPARAASVE